MADPEGSRLSLRRILEEDRLRNRNELASGMADWTEKYPYIFRGGTVPEGSYLDIGSNDGRFTRWLKNRQIDRRVIAFDILNFGRVPDFVRGTARALPFRDNSINNVVAFFSVPTWSTPQVPEDLVLSEMTRVAIDRVIIWPARPEKDYSSLIPDSSISLRRLLEDDNFSAQNHVLIIEKQKEHKA